MPYVRRTPAGQIDSLHLTPGGATPAEFLPDGHDELLAFVGAAAGSADFELLDAGFVRVLEDLIDALIARHALNITDLPAEAQAKLFARKSFRERASKSALHLLAPDGSDVI